MKIAPFLLLTVALGAWAEAQPNLPPDAIVARVLRASPAVQAAAGQVRVEEANRSRLAAGPDEWNQRRGAHPRRV